MDFFEEVKHEDKIDKISLFLRRFWKVIIIAICLILSSLVALYFWQQHHEKLTIITANDYDKALAAERNEKKKLLEDIVNRDDSMIFKVMALMQLAEISAEEQDYNKLSYYYKEVTNVPNVPQEYSDYAQLMLIKTQITAKQIKNAEIKLLLINYIESDKYFKDLARLYVASIYIDDGENQKAHDQLNFLLAREHSRDAGYISSLARELLKKARVN